MNRRHWIAFTGLILLLVIIFALKNVHTHISSVSSPSRKRDAPMTSNFVKFVVPPPLSPPDPHLTSRGERIAWENKMGKVDPYYEYKLPIEFYGKVVDDQGQPVAGASVAFVWMDLSPEGTSRRNTTSDEAGGFSLTGAAGKTLTVEVNKEGYDHYYSSNRFGFDFSILSYPDRYYAPDPMNPVLFVLRQKRKAEMLEVRQNQEAKIKPGESKLFSISHNGATVLITCLTNLDARIFDVSVPGGGLRLTTEEFPFQAPTGDYGDHLLITNGIALPPNWPWGLGAMLYIKTAEGYGRVKMHYSPNKSWVYVDSWFNPNLSSRNLEPGYGSH